MSKEMILTINSEIFDNFREEFDKMLHKMISDMDEKIAQDGKLTAEVAVNIIDTVKIDRITGEVADKKILLHKKIPSFKFKIGSAINIKTKVDFKQNYLDGELILNDSGEYAIREKKDQINLLDEE